MEQNAQVAVLDKLDAVTFDKLLATQDPFGIPGCRFDLSDVRLITPTGLVQLAAASFALAAKGRRPVILFKNPSVVTYLTRAGFMAVVGEVAEIRTSSGQFLSWDYGLRRHSNPMLIEVTKLEKGSELPRLLDQIVWVLRNRLKYRKNDAFDAATAVSEICQNTFDHNQDTYGFIAMQVYGKGRKRFVEIGVADFGSGLATTLARNPKNAPASSDIDAIRQATQLGVSEHDDPTRGTGLHHLLDIAFKHQGSVQIRSCNAKIRYRTEHQSGWGFTVPRMQGVQIALTLRAKQTC